MKASLEEFLKSIQKLSRDEMIQLLVHMKEDEMNQSVILTEMQKTSTAMTKDYARLKNKIDTVETENRTLKKTVAKLSEQNAALNRKLFGRQSEKMDCMDHEPVTEDPLAEEPEDSRQTEESQGETEKGKGNESGKPKKPQGTERPPKKSPGKKKTRQGMNLDNLPADHKYDLNVEQLDAMYGPGWEIVSWHTTRKVEHVEEFNYVKYTHMPVVKSADGKMYSLPFGEVLRKYSIVTSSLAASIMYKKIFLGIPLYRQEEDLAAKDFPLSRQDMANWMIYFAFHLFGPVYDYLWDILRKCPWTQHDETTLQVIRDGRLAGWKSFMWVHMTSELYEGNPIILFAYELTRKADHLREYFQNYQGTMSSDAYAAYYTFASEHIGAITLAGCLMHARRPFAQSLALAGAGSMTEEEKTAMPEYRPLQLLGQIFAIETELKNLSADERKERRTVEVRPLMDEYFSVIHSLDPEKPEYSEKMKKGIRYSLNHETELRRFLEDGHIPCDNGFAERHIRPFATSRKTWMFCNTIDGAKAIAILYTLVETARSNNVDVYYYLKYLLDNMPRYMEGKDRSFLADMMPWSQAVKDYIEEQKRSMIEQFNLNPDKDPPNKKKSQSDSLENESA